MASSLPVLIFLVSLLQATWGQVNDACNNNLGIIGGHTVSVKDVPYIAALYKDDEGFCGGSIIHDQFILTAAHCVVQRTGNFSVLLGSDSLTTGGILMDVDQILCHEDYDPEIFDNDICLLKLTDTVPYGRKIAKIDLPESELDIEEGTLVNVTGWGNIKIDGVFDPDDLRQTTVPVVSDECCRQLYPYMTKNMFCAGSRGHDSCQGDSGGPLTYNNVQIGVVSFGNGCAIVAGVYAKLSEYLTWIETTISDNL